ncbi:hypothetical protein ILYODFUR_034948 [Ilyodon furcidens]|uniref:Uncharacterized protein n=1 Tax=Ilyodon furcidens TaxID=33524 RepID=A0ABV0UAW7_9TELE
MWRFCPLLCCWSRWSIVRAERAPRFFCLCSGFLRLLPSLLTRDAAIIRLYQLLFRVISTPPRSGQATEPSSAKPESCKKEIDLFSYLSLEAEKTLQRSAGLPLPQSAYDGSRLVIPCPGTGPLSCRSSSPPLHMGRRSLPGLSERLVHVLVPEPCDEGFEDESSSEPVPERFEDEPPPPPIPERFEKEIVLILTSESGDEGFEDEPPLDPVPIYEGPPDSASASEGPVGSVSVSKGPQGTVKSKPDSKPPEFLKGPLRSMVDLLICRPEGPLLCSADLHVLPFAHAKPVLPACPCLFFATVFFRHPADFIQSVQDLLLLDEHGETVDSHLH